MRLNFPSNIDIDLDFCIGDIGVSWDTFHVVQWIMKSNYKNSVM